MSTRAPDVRPASVERPSGPAALIALQGALALAAITLVTTLAVIALVPAFIGWRSDVVVSGSMQPNIAVGDVVALSSPPAQVAPGMVLSFSTTDQPGKSVLHRVIALDDAGTITTKGDANPTADSQPITTSDVSALGRIVVPAVGLPVLWLRTGNWPMLAAFAVVIGLAVTALKRDRRLQLWHRHHAALPPEARHEPIKWHAHAPRHRAAWVATVVTSAALVLGTASLAFGSVTAAFSATSQATASWSAAPLDQAYTLSVLDAQPTLYLPLDDAARTGGAILDGSGNGMTATANGTWSYRVGSGPLISAPTSAMSNQSTSASITTNATNRMTSDWSLQLWFKTTGAGKLASLTDGGTTGNPILTSYVATNGTLRTSMQTSGGSTVSINSGLRVDDGTWHHLVVSSGTTAGATKAATTLYLDGSAVGTTTSVPRTSTAALQSFGYARDNRWSLPSEPSITGMVRYSQIGQISTHDVALSGQQVLSFWTAAGN